MDPLRLKAGGYAGTYKLIGGRPSLDFVNTLSWPDSEREHDWLDSMGNWIRWAAAVGPADAESTRPFLNRRWGADEEGRLLGFLRERRDRIRSVLAPLAQGNKPSRRALSEFQVMLDQALEHRRIDPESLRWTWTVIQGVEDWVWPIVYDAALLLTGEGIDQSRLGACPSCSWLFYDNTKNRSRRWCDMLDCGSRSKSRRYYRRTKGPASRAAGPAHKKESE